jgi:hypothetical protein
MEIKKYKEEILKKILYSLEEVIFSKEKENNFQYATYLFNTKIKYIDKKKTQYKLIFEIKDILNNKVLFLWEWFVDENKNVKTFLEFQSKIKKLANYEGNNFSDEFDSIFIFYCVNFVKLDKVIETIIFNQGIESIDYFTVFRLFLILVLEKKIKNINLYMFFKDTRKIKKISEYNMPEKNNREIELETNFYSFSSMIEKFENTIIKEKNELIITKYYCVNIANLFKENFKNKKEKFFEILKKQLKEDSFESYYISLDEIKGKREFDYLLEYIDFCEKNKLEYDDNIINSGNKNLKEMIVSKILDKLISELTEIKDIRNVRKKINADINDINVEILKKFDIEKSELLEHLEMIENKELKKKYKKLIKELGNESKENS